MAESFENVDRAGEKHHERAGKWWMFLIRWTIAIVGIGWVLLNVPLYDKVTIVDPADGHPVKVTLAEDVGDHVPDTVKIIDPRKKTIREVKRSELVNSPDAKWVVVREPSGRERERLLALDLSDDLKTVRRFLVENAGGKGEWVPPDRVINYTLSVPYPLVDQGIVPMIRKANQRYLWLAVLIFPITFLITSLRWHLLLRAVDIRIGAARIRAQYGGRVLQHVYARFDRRRCAESLLCRQAFAGASHAHGNERNRRSCDRHVGADRAGRGHCR